MHRHYCYAAEKLNSFTKITQQGQNGGSMMQLLMILTTMKYFPLVDEVFKSPILFCFTDSIPPLWWALWVVLLLRPSF